jgi:malate dehydrogenase (oxaloacetate-decarboxylating)
MLEKEILGGMLKICGKMSVDNLIDYEMNVLGATELTLNMMRGGQDPSKYSGISKNVGLFCGIPAGSNPEQNHFKLYTLLERDSIIINKFTGLNAFPILVKLNQFDDFIKIIQGVESTFAAIRIFNLEDIDDISLYERIYDEINVPILAQYSDEIPLNLLIAVSHLLTKNNIEKKNCTVGIIGINIGSLRTVRLLIKLGFQRILGSDNNIKRMHSFEREGGLATTQENILNNSDLIIIFKDQLDVNNLTKVGSGQILISLIDKEFDINIIKERGIRDFLQSRWMDSSALFSGILKGLVDSKLKYLDDDKLIKLSNKIVASKAEEEILPDVFSELHQNIPKFVHDL